MVGSKANTAGGAHVETARDGNQSRATGDPFLIGEGASAQFSHEPLKA